MPEDNEGLAPTTSRYRALLDVSSTIVQQPSVQTVLQSLRGVLSDFSAVHGVDLFLLSDDRNTLQVFAFDRAPDAPAFNVGTKALRIGAAARVLDEQKPVFVPDSSQEMLKHPELAPFAPQVVGRSAYLFPVSTSRKRYGILSVTKLQGQVFVPEDVKLMHSLASLVAAALEAALATGRAESYQRETRQRARPSSLAA